MLLDEALARKLARVTEISDSGSVPELMFSNEAEANILLMDGEELVGAKQNRVLNVSILVGGKSQVAVPVSCVEQGRWRWSSRHFASPGRALF
ncbi:MAG: ARPP-1 family domain-containing protein, partial [Betaproteobacteria bacterium]